MTQPDPVAEPVPAFALGEWRQLAPGIYLAVAEPETVNVGLVVGTESALLVDTGSSPAQGAAIRASLSRVTPLPLRGVVITHWHYDHAFGIAAFPGVPVIGHETVRARLRSAEAAHEAARLGVDPAELAAPNRAIALATSVDLGGRRVEIAHLGRGHTDGDLVVVAADADVVFVGDLIESAGAPSYGPDSYRAEWPGTLDALIGLMTRSTVAVPGHGEPVDREFVFEQRGRVAAASAEQRTALPLLGPAEHG
jgi:glyoxylase-like metal-dependent hydrolase (beta-lactamase superfamily II)